MPEFLPGTDQPVPPLMTAVEAVKFLRLDIISRADGSEKKRDMVDSLRSLDHLIRRGRIRPARVGKNRRFLRAELDRFLHATTTGERSNP